MCRFVVVVVVVRVSLNVIDYHRSQVLGIRNHRRERVRRQRPLQRRNSVVLHFSHFGFPASSDRGEANIGFDGNTPDGQHRSEEDHVHKL